MLETARYANQPHAETAKVVAPPGNIDLQTYGGDGPLALHGETHYRQTQLQPSLDVALKYGQLKAPYDSGPWVTDAQP